MSRHSELIPAKKNPNNPYKMSAWTPRTHSANTAMFADRRELVKKWFNNWSDKQKKLLIKDILDNSDVKLHQHIHQEVKARHPFPEGMDFTRILPRNLSLKIFKYLKPSELCQASLVSHQWKEIAENEEIWFNFCRLNNWNLQKPASKYERAVWKRLYSSMMFQTFQAANYYQPNGYNMTQDQLMLLNNRFQNMNSRPGSSMGTMSPPNPFMVNNMQHPPPGFSNNQTFPSNRPPMIGQNPLTNSGMIATSSNYALLHQLNLQNMTPRTNNNNSARPGTASTLQPVALESSRSKISQNQNNQETDRQSRASRPSTKNSLRRSSRPVSRSGSLTRKGRVREGSLDNRPAWKSNDKKALDTRRKHYDLNESFLSNRPPTPKQYDTVQSKINTNNKPPSRPSSRNRVKKRAETPKNNLTTSQQIENELAAPSNQTQTAQIPQSQPNILQINPSGGVPNESGHPGIPPFYPGNMQNGNLVQAPVV